MNEKIKTTITGKIAGGEPIKMTVITGWSTFCSLVFDYETSGIPQHFERQIDTQGEGDLLRSLKTNEPADLHVCEIVPLKTVVKLVFCSKCLMISFPRSDFEKAFENIDITVFEDGTQTELPTCFGENNDAMIATLHSDGTADIESTAYENTIDFKKIVEIDGITHEQLLNLKKAIDFAIEHTEPSNR